MQIPVHISGFLFQKVSKDRLKLFITSLLYNLNLVINVLMQLFLTSSYTARYFCQEETRHHLL